MATVFSTYNLSGQMDAFKRAMDLDDMEEISQLLNIESDDTIILLFVRGDYSEAITSLKQEEHLQLSTTRIRNKSIF